MAKFCLKKPSKRIQARKRYKIEKKVREHNRKIRKDAKKHPKKKSKVLEVPNQCPFKEDILKEVEAMRKQQEEEKLKQREAAKEKKRQELAKNGLTGLVANAENKQAVHENTDTIRKDDVYKRPVMNQENSLKAYYKEFKKVVDLADVILEVVDARDPLGTRCKQVEEAVKSAPGNKRLVIVVNKADLVPRENLDQWLKYLRASLPAVPFKASTQDQTRRLGRRILDKKTTYMQHQTCFGAELLLSLLGNYCRNIGNVKTSITVGVVGLPNVGKSSVINSLNRSKSCYVGSVPGVTKVMQVIQLDSKIQLLDSPGIVFANPKSGDGDSDDSMVLRNAVKLHLLKDSFGPATAILKRISKQQILDLYDIPDFQTYDDFFPIKAARMGKFRRGGIPDALAAARSVIDDWNMGKIRYYTVPPEQSDCHVSAEIVNQIANEFNIESFAAEEKMMLDEVEASALENPTVQDPLLIESTGPVTAAREMEIQKEAEYKLQEQKKKKAKDAKKKVPEVRKKKIDPLFEIEGNQKLNKLKKLQFKKEKKDRARQEKVSAQLVDQLEEVNLTTTDEYNFNTDFTAL